MLPSRPGGVHDPELYKTRLSKRNFGLIERDLFEVFAGKVKEFSQSALCAPLSSGLYTQPERWSQDYFGSVKSYLYILCGLCCHSLKYKKNNLKILVPI